LEEAFEEHNYGTAVLVGDRVGLGVTGINGKGVLVNVICSPAFAGVGVYVGIYVAVISASGG